MRRLLFLVPVVALALTGCSSPSAGPTASSAATVNGTAIPTDTFLADAAVFASAQVKSDPSTSDQVYGPTDGSFTMSFTASQLQTAIAEVLVQQEVERRNLTPNDDDRAQAAQQFDQEFPGPPKGIEVSDEFKQRQIDILSDVNALTRVLKDEAPGVTDEEVRAQYDQNIDQAVATDGDFACVTYLIAPYDPGQSGGEITQEMKDASTAKINEALADPASADFETFAKNTTDPTGAIQGGSTCLQKTAQLDQTYIDALFNQPIGEVGPLVTGPDAAAVFLVRSRGKPSFEDMEAGIRQTLEQQQSQSGSNPLSDWIKQQVTDADITVDPRFGSWDPTKGVVPPPGADDPSSATTTIDGLGTDLTTDTTQAP